MNKYTRQIIIPVIILVLVLALISPGFAEKTKEEKGKTEEKGKVEEKDKEKPKDKITVWEIIPGASISGIAFGKTPIESVVKYFGNLDSRSKDLTTIYYQKTWGLNFTYDKKTNIVTSVMVVKPEANGRRYITNSKIMVGEPIKKALYAYGKPKTTIQHKGYVFHNYFIKDEFLTFISKGPVIMMIWTGKKTAYAEKIEQIKGQLQ